MIKFRAPFLFLSTFLLCMISSCKKDPLPPDPNDPYNNEFELNYLCEAAIVDSNGGSWIYTNEYSYDRIIRFKFEDAILVYDGQAYYIREIEELGPYTHKYIFQTVSTSSTQFMHCTIDTDANTVIATYHGYKDPISGDDSIIREYSGSLSSSGPTASPNLEFSSLSGFYELTFTNDYIDDDFDTTYVDTLDVQFTMDGLLIGEIGYVTQPFHSYYSHRYEENDQMNSYLINSYDYQLSPDSIWLLDQFRLVVDSIPQVWSDRMISGTKL